MDEILTSLITLFIKDQGLANLVYLLISAILVILIPLAKRLVARQKDSIIKEVVLEAVQWVEQDYGGVKFGDDKVALVTDYVVGKLTSRYKLTIDVEAHDEIHKLVSSTVKNLKDEYGDDWDKKPKEDPVAVVYDAGNTVE